MRKIWKERENGRKRERERERERESERERKRYTEREGNEYRVLTEQEKLCTRR